MSRPAGRPSRRDILLGLAAAGAVPRRGTARTEAPPPTGSMLEQGPPALRDPTLLVAGPADTAPGRWATLLAPRLGQAMQVGSALAVSATGGRDGVTGANAFEALTTPDGSTAMLVPGAAAIAWLAGDPRVHFDPARWVPALASLSSGVLVARGGGGGGLAGRTLRTAASTATGPELPALLGLSMLGARPAPAFGLSEPEDATAALRADRVDAVFLAGHDVPARLRGLQAAGFMPVFSLGAIGDDVEARDAVVAGVPAFAELYRMQTGHAPTGALFAAWRATAAAATIDTALVLPSLAPAALVARWRSACQSAVSDLGLVSAAMRAQVDPVPAPRCVQALSRINADETTQLALRRWLAAQTGWL